MSIRRYMGPLLAVAVVGGLGYGAFRTRETWQPYVFPEKAAKSTDGHGAEGGKDEHAGHDHGARGDRVKLSPQAQKNLALDVDTLVPQEYWRTMMIPGVVVDRPGESDRGVTSKVAGVVLAIKARPGDTIRAGEPLFTIQLASEFLQSAQSDLGKAARELEFAAAKRDRTAELVKKGTAAGSLLIEDENQVKRITTQLQAFRRQLQVFGLTPEQVDKVEKGDVITELTIVAPGSAVVNAIAAKNGAPPITPALYEVQELKVTLGEQVIAGQTLCLLANHQKLYVEGRAFKSEADALASATKQKTPVRVEFADETVGAWPAQEPLIIHHLSNQVDQATRTFAFFLPLENQPATFERDGKTLFLWRYRPGQRVRLMLPVERLVGLAPDGKTEILPFVLPAGAVVREGPEAYIFVQSGDIFIRKPVHLLYADRTDAVVANDGTVSEAEFVVRNQAAAINRKLKADAGAGGGGHEGHDHAH